MSRASLLLLDTVTNMITNTTRTLVGTVKEHLGGASKITYLFECTAVTAAASLQVNPVWNAGGGGGNLNICTTTQIGATGVSVLPLNAALTNTTAGGNIPFPTHVLYTITADKTTSGNLYALIA